MLHFKTELVKKLLYENLEFAWGKQLSNTSFQQISCLPLLNFNSQNVLFNLVCKRKDVGYLTEIPEKSKSTGKRASRNLGSQDMFHSNSFLPKVNVDNRNRESTRNE